LYLGIDLGTSAVKCVLVGADQRVIAEGSAPLTVQRPAPDASEQDPAAWWDATRQAIADVRARHAEALLAVRAIGLAGQMHGATLLDAADRVLRPAILWNDGRSAPQCVVLEQREPRSRAITGNRAMPGFTAPKLLWVAEYEPSLFARVARVLLPKDWLRLRLTGEAVSEMSDAAGTLWLDVGARRWSPEMLAATRLPLSAMPRLVEGSEPSAALRAEAAAELGLRPGIVVAGGAGDNAGAAAGMGVVRPGDALLSLGTSGVYFVAGAAFAPNPARAVHAFCHCLPGRWHQMAVTLSAASCLAWLARVMGGATEADLVAEVDTGGCDPGVLFLPYLSGERTPHDDPRARGVFFGLGHTTTRADLVRAVLEGVAFAFADGQDALVETGAEIGRVSVVGGGARSPVWGRILASALGRPLDYRRGGELGPAFGAARLARLADTGEYPEDVCVAPERTETIGPDPALAAPLAERLERWRRLYRELRPLF